MFKRKKDILDVIEHSEKTLNIIEAKYKTALHNKSIDTALRIEIKNFCENLRSVLDYLACEIREVCCSEEKQDDRYYFPIFQEIKQFESQMNKWFPGLKSSKIKLWNYLESIQPFQSGFKWLGYFNQINNENKHKRLVEQTRIGRHEVRVNIKGGGHVSWNPECTKYGNGVFIGGVPVNPITQMPMPHPTQEVERIIWVDFHFEGIGISAISLLKQSLDGIKKISAEIYELLQIREVNHLKQ